MHLTSHTDRVRAEHQTVIHPRGRIHSVPALSRTTVQRPSSPFPHGYFNRFSPSPRREDTRDQSRARSQYHLQLVRTHCRFRLIDLLLRLLFPCAKYIHFRYNHSKSSPLPRTAFKAPLPALMSTTFCPRRSITRVKYVLERPDMCGVRTTLGIVNSSWPSGKGSGSVTL